MTEISIVDKHKFTNFKRIFRLTSEEKEKLWAEPPHR
jgi:hypothetical protein